MKSIIKPYSLRNSAINQPMPFIMGISASFRFLNVRTTDAFAITKCFIVVIICHLIILSLIKTYFVVKYCFNNSSTFLLIVVFSFAHFTRNL